MSILKKIFSGAGSNLVESVGGVIDNLVTTDEEKLDAKRKLKELIMNHEAQMEKNKKPIINYQKSEVSKVEWMSYENCITSIRPYNLGASSS